MRLIRHTGIYVKDLERMKEFYCRYFDMEVFIHAKERRDYIEKLLGTSPLSVELYKIARKDGTMVELLKPGIAQPKDVHSNSVISFGCMHIAFTVADLDKVHAEMLDEGIEFLSEPTVSPHQKAYVCFCRDPEGNYLELVQELPESA